MNEYLLTEDELIANETLEQRLKRMPFNAQLRKLFNQAVAMKIPEEEIMVLKVCFKRKKDIGYTVWGGYFQYEVS